MSTRDQMDDGTPICLAVTVDRRDGSAVFDFEGGGLLAPHRLLAAAAGKPAMSHVCASAWGLAALDSSCGWQ